MHSAAGQLEEWVDGFLFVGNRPILDLLNTKPILADAPEELLADTHALERWLIASGMVTCSRTKSLLRSWRNGPEAAAFLSDLIAFRERLRSAVVAIENGSQPSDSLLAEVNSLLVQYPRRTALHTRGGKVVIESRFEPLQPSDFWAPIVGAAADLLSDPESSRIRKCDSCVIHFFDTSKKGSRRWCSMKLCGNKLKVATYQKRRRASDLSVD